LRRCTIVIADAGPFNSLRVAAQLSLLLALDMPVIVIDAVYDELTSDPSYPKDRAVKAFIDANARSGRQRRSQSFCPLTRRWRPSIIPACRGTPGTRSPRPSRAVSGRC
jgi:hypothetical protein